ncbi:MAG: glycoside hydrolase family 18 protein, partial [Anaerolineales bacterium]|nr:glycoside hydrolase family 18 protein [Anaerolineales bacterium]
MQKAERTIELVMLLLLAVSCASAPTPTATPAPQPTRAAAATLVPSATLTPTATVTLVPSPSPTRALKFRLIAYFAGWSTAPSRGYRVTDIPADKLTHLNYAFASVSPQGECITGDASADARNFPELQKLKRTFPHLIILISIGGAGAQNFANAAQSAEARRKFARSCVAFM